MWPVSFIIATGFSIHSLPPTKNGVNRTLLALCHGLKGLSGTGHILNS